NGNITGPKIVPARFGPPWAGKTYDLFLPGRRGTNGIQDGYDVLAHLANQPFAQEYISIKLCRLFVHDDFPNPSNDPASEAYAFYDYAGGSLSPEAELVHQCMLAWENSNPRGQIREVLNAIFSSDLFRRHGASMQKVKTPLEFTVSAIRALRSAGANGTYTADTDGYSLVVINGSASLAPLGRLGGMALFDRAEPNGYAEAGPPWISAGTLAERLRFVQGFLIATNQSGRADVGNCACNPVALLQSRLPNTSWKDAGAVADFFLRI